MGNTRLERHDLVYLTPEGKAQVYCFAKQEATAQYGEELLKKVLKHCPGIVCAQGQRSDGMIKLGFSWYERLDGNRIRLSSAVSPDQIARVVHPDQIFNLPKPEAPFKEPLALIRQWAKSYGIKTGIFGSWAMELATKLPYTDQESDLDLIVWWQKGKNIRDFYEKCKLLLGADKVDMELLFEGIGSVKAQEWFSPANVLLVKNIRGAELVPRSAFS